MIQQPCPNLQQAKYADRLLALRKELRGRRLAGFIIPHADEYQNEYIPPSAERLAWLTGFTGSAGTAVVLEDQAAIFVDGRYIVQVQQEVDVELFTPYQIPETSMFEWIATALKPNQRLGYDPWLHTPEEVERVASACQRAEAECVACQGNPIDAIWKDRPLPPVSPAVPHPLQFSGKPSLEKRNELAQQLQHERVEAAVLTAPSSIAWLLNIRGKDVAYTPLPLCFAVIYRDRSVQVFIDPRKVTEALTAFLDEQVTLQTPEAFARVLDELGQRRARVLCDPSSSPAWVWERLGSAGAVRIEGDDPCALPKACKNQTELEGARKAHSRDGAAVCRFLAWLIQATSSERVTELEAAAYLDECRRQGTFWQDLSFPTISAFGPNGAIVHYRVTEKTNRTLKPGGLYLVDSGAQYLDGTTDVTRTVAIGRPTDEHRDRYTRVLKGHIALATTRFPKGTTGSQLDVLARQFLWGTGLDYDHGTGHGVGSYLGVHEGPQRISKSPNRVPLLPGMIVSNEPGYYKAGAYGIRLENLVVVVPARDLTATEREMLAFEPLTLVPFDRRLIDVSLLTAEERAWINTYHAQVRQTLSSLIDEETAQWLDEATQPL
ncbi:MAG: aminopeptidase P family protein [Nitrospirae bacterium]|nr:MAG: aminopeptidase P family protein [Nitrospirota bacterium]